MRDLTLYWPSLLIITVSMQNRPEDLLFVCYETESQKIRNYGQGFPQ